MTPISFALEILLDCETIEEAHKKCRKYIKNLESQTSSLVRNANFPNLAIHPGAPTNIQQSPSTQRLLEMHGPVSTMPAIKIPAAEIDRETGRPMTATGNGMKGPRKF